MTDPRIPDGKKFFSRFNIWQGIILGVTTVAGVVGNIVRNRGKKKKPIQKLGGFLCPYDASVLEDHEDTRFCRTCRRHYEKPAKM
jgi:hypothetical protein